VTAAPAAAARPVARHVSDWLDPRMWITVVTIAVGWHAAGLAGAGWGLLAVAAAVILPALIVRHGVRLGRYADRHITDRRQRIPVLLFAAASVTTCMALLAMAGAPRAVIALTIAMLAAITVITAVTAVWKISVHCAVAAGGATVLVITFGPALAVTYLAVGLAAWSRVALGDHTPAQAATGVLAGASSALIFLALT
jgi:hypothetical protein